ncbi:hypothetical protein FIBSPDRAFT_602242 [Athelia psychrophila]|uniref:Uncharacterized protein n=1 Tax=Athelia psychrophila TaxID=1759441 RepID=A0A166GV19_9AGAM|nr:hypothetical protein FIBSPDRAFT_602242 [Fibularhizoctonia sp. CBS 109695]
MAMAFDRISKGNRAPPPTHDPTRQANPRDSQFAPGSMSRGHSSATTGIESEGDFNSMARSHRISSSFWEAASQEPFSLQRDFHKCSQDSAMEDDTRDAQAAPGLVSGEHASASWRQVIPLRPSVTPERLEIVSRS